MVLLLPFLNALPFLRLLSPSNTANPTSTRRTGSDLPIFCLRRTTAPPRAGRSPLEPPTSGSSFHGKERGGRGPVGNPAPRSWSDVAEGVRSLARAVTAAAAAAALLCAGTGTAEASLDNGRRIPPSFPCADVSGYYSGLDGLEGTALMRRLGAIVSVHRSLRYKEVWDALKILDAADPDDPENSPEMRALMASFIWPNRQTLLDRFT